MLKFLLGFILLFVLSPVIASHKIFVIHGYSCPRMWMKKIDNSLKRGDFITENYGYKSMREDLDSIGKHLYQDIKKSGVDTVSFVTHSMGALVVRSMIQYSRSDKNFPLIYRIVMIAPPNTGAELADFLTSFRILKKLMGPNMQYMKTDSGCYACRLPIPYGSEVGLIVGMRGKKHGYNPFIRGDNDGTLTPGRAKLGIEKDFVGTKAGHIMIARKKIVCKLVLAFLKSGTFASKGTNLI